MPTLAHLNLQRFPDWPERLSDFLQERLKTPFAWGGNDCCLFAADDVMVLTGTDPAAEWRGAYETAAGAAALIESIPGGLLMLINSLLGEPLPSTALARRGDIVYASRDLQPMLGVVSGSGEWCAPGDDGLIFFPMVDAVAAWRV